MAYRVDKTEDDWRQELSPQEYAVLRQAGTEPAFTGEYTDTETGLVYYGRRSYRPETGRWLDQGPTVEQGGVSFAAFPSHDPGNRAGRQGTGDRTASAGALSESSSQGNPPASFRR